MSGRERQRLHQHENGVRKQAGGAEAESGVAQDGARPEQMPKLEDEGNGVTGGEAKYGDAKERGGHNRHYSGRLEAGVRGIIGRPGLASLVFGTTIQIDRAVLLVHLLFLAALA